MADKEEKTESAPLTEAQRIEKLEKNVGTSKLVLMIVALLLIMIISVSVTAFVLFVAKDSKKDSGEWIAQIESLQTELTSLSAKLEEKELKIVTLEDRATTLESQLKTSSNGVILSMLLQQEEDNQAVLDVARSSIYDLAHMVPGSRTWLEAYTDDLDQAMESSKQRQSTLNQMIGGASAAAEEDDGFGDF